MAENSTKTGKISPRSKANFLSHLLFCWQLPIFFKGYKKPLTEDDLYDPLQEHESSYLGDKLENAWLYELKLNPYKPSLWRALRRVFGGPFALYGLAMIPMKLIFRLSQPLLLGQLMNYYVPGQTTMSRNQAYLYSFLLVLMLLFYLIFTHSYGLGTQHLGMKIRVACSSLIYRKTLKLNQKALEETSTGQIINLLSNDVGKFESAIMESHYLWMGPLETLVAMYILYIDLGVTAIVGIVFLLLLIPVQALLANQISAYRIRTALKTDQRIKLMDEIIKGVKVIKMYTWENVFGNLVENSRRSEMGEVKTKLYLYAANRTCTFSLSKISVLLSILTYTLNGHILDPRYVYVLSSFYDIIKTSASLFFPMSLMFWGEISTSVSRIQKFLLAPEIESKIISLEGVSVTVKPSQLVAIIGPVGSGKSTLLQVALGEIDPVNGPILGIQGTISYASQEPWLFPGTIKDNIVFREQYHQSKYHEIVKICELEQDFSLLPNGDLSLVGEKGVLLSGGQKSRINLARAIYKDADFYLLDDPLSAVDACVSKQLFDNCIQNYLGTKARVLVTQQFQFLQNVDVIYLVENGRVTASGSFQELQNTSNEFLTLLTSEKKKQEMTDETASLDKKQKHSKQLEVKEHQITGSVFKKVYCSYFKGSGNLFLPIISIVLFLLVQTISNGSDYFLLFWVNLEQENFDQTGLNSRTCLFIYVSLNAVLIVATIVCHFTFYYFSTTTSTNLHNKMFNNIVHMPMQFFYDNHSGRILNRFSQDMGAIDEQLPIYLTDALEFGLNIVAIMVIISVINPWILLPSLIIFVLCYYYRAVYLATSRNLKRVESIKRSPIFGHVSSSVVGLATIRACNAQNRLRVEFDQHQNVHSSAYYLFLACDRALGFWLSVCSVIYTGLVTLSFLFFIGTETCGANVGLSINQAVYLTLILQYVMRQWSTLENQMVSVERVVEYVENKPEDESNGTTPPSWPSNGNVSFRSVSMHYSPESPFVLNEVSFEVNPKEKIGIVGRTGAGKSSLVSIFFRLTDFEGEVLIDGASIRNLSLSHLRCKISIIPQDPVLFSGTIKSNLDPFNEYQDRQIWDALEEVQLKSMIADLPLGLFSKVNEGGVNLSVGQRQLLCLARAVIRMNKILILDEATASVDPHTDELIQDTIRKKFIDCTVLTIAHRLHTVLDCDRIMVMAGGKIVQFDSPRRLLENKTGSFYKLLKQSGKNLPDGK